MSREQGSSPVSVEPAAIKDQSATSTAGQTGTAASTPSSAVQHRCTCMTNESPRSPVDSSTVITIPPTSAYWSCDDDPPPYASLIGPPPEHPSYGWSYVFPAPNAHYEDTGGGGATAAGANGENNRSIARQLVSIPLTSYGIFKIEPPRYAAATANSAIARPLPYPRLIADPGPSVKASPGTARKYGAILIAAMVIIFLMLLSLMVRLVTEKSLWRG